MWRTCQKLPAAGCGRAAPQAEADKLREAKHLGEIFQEMMNVHKPRLPAGSASSGYEIPNDYARLSRKETIRLRGTGRQGSLGMDREWGIWRLR